MIIYCFAVLPLMLLVRPPSYREIKDGVLTENIAARNRCTNFSLP